MGKVLSKINFAYYFKNLLKISLHILICYVSVLPHKYLLWLVCDVEVLKYKNELFQNFVKNFCYFLLSHGAMPPPPPLTQMFK